MWKENSYLKSASMSDKYVLISGITTGNDSKSGLAFECQIKDETVWVPYSQCRSREINKKIKGEDAIVIAKWWADKNELEGDPI